MTAPPTTAPVDRPGLEPSVHARRWWILGTLVLSLLVVVLDNSILNIALKTIQQDLGATQSELAWAVNAYTLVFAGLLFTYGVLGDRYGRRLALVVGLTLFGGASVLCAFASTPEQLIACRALMGIGGAAVFPSTLSIITHVFEPAERAKAIGIWAGFVGAAIAIGPITGGLLLERFWWGSVFLVNLPVVAVALLAIVVLVPESKDPTGQRLDPLGVVLSITGLVLVVYGIIKGGETAQWSGAVVLGPLLGGVVVLGLFVLLQRRSSSPMLDVGLFRTPAFSAACAAVTLVMFALFGTVFFLSFYLQFAREYSPLEAGVRLLPVAVAMVVLAPRSAALVRRFGAKAVCGTGLLVVAVSFGGYRFVDETTSTALVSLLLFLQGAGMANVMAPATESIMSTLPREGPAPGRRSTPPSARSAARSASRCSARCCRRPTATASHRRWRACPTRRARWPRSRSAARSSSASSCRSPWPHRSSGPPSTRSSAPCTPPPPARRWWRCSARWWCCAGCPVGSR